MLSTLNRQKIPQLGSLKNSTNQFYFSNRHQDTNRSHQQIENIEIKNIFHLEIFNQLLQVWQDNEIPEIHQKYFYNLLLNNQQSLQHIIANEIEDIQSGESSIKTLHLLTIAREKCLKEALKEQYINPKTEFVDFVKNMSIYVYHLRKLTVSLVSYYRKWSNKLISLYKYNYRWIYNNQNYILKMKEDHKQIQNKHPQLLKFLHFSSNEDVFYVSIVNQAMNSDIEYFDYLKVHQMDNQKLAKIHELQNYIRTLFMEDDIPLPKQPTITKFHSPTPSVMVTPSKLSSSRQVPLQQDPNEDVMPEYESRQIFTNQNITFTLKKWVIRDMKIIMKHYDQQCGDEYRKSFLMPMEEVSEILSFGVEAFMVQIDETGLMLASVDPTQQCRSWIIHMILFRGENKFYQVIQGFIEMMENEQDRIEQLQVNLMVDKSNKEFKPFKDALLQHNFRYIKTQYDKYRVNSYNVFALGIHCEFNTNNNRPYYNELLFVYYRTLSVKYKNQFICDEQLMEAQMCANLGRSHLIQFSQPIQIIADQLKKQKLYGQQYTLVNQKADVTNYVQQFKSEINSPVHLQQFSFRLNFMAFTTEIHKETQHPYMRVIAGDHREGDLAILELSATGMEQKLYLIPTIDPSIKIFVYELHEEMKNINQLITLIFEKYDKKAECRQNIWIPYFDAKGHRVHIDESVMNAYFQNESHFTINYPKLGLNSFNNVVNLDKLIKPPFLIGIIQNDLENINRPMFSLMVLEEHCIRNQVFHNPSQKVDKEAELNVCQINQNQIQSKIQEILAFSNTDIRLSFQQDYQTLYNILTYGQEVSVLQLFNKHNLQGFCLAHIDSNHLVERRWLIELVSAKDFNYFDIILQYVSDLIFTEDNAASEIHIYQIHIPDEQGQLQMDKNIAAGIKKAGFRWRQVDNDAKTQTRKTIYYKKRNDQYQDKQNYDLAINFNSYYSLQESEIRNKKDNELMYLETPKYFNILEDIFHYKMDNLQLDNNPFIKERILKAQGRLQSTKWDSYPNINQLKQHLKYGEDLPKIPLQHDKIYTQLVEVPLHFKKCRCLQLDNTPYIELAADPNLFMVSDKENKMNIYYVQTMNPFYYFFISEIKHSQVIEVESNLLKYTTIICQNFSIKKNIQWDILFPGLDMQVDRQTQSNWLHMAFSAYYYQTIEQRIVRDKGNRYKSLQLPFLVGIIDEQMLNDYERPLIAFVAQ